MENQITQLTSGENFFQEVANLFTGSTKVFFNHLIWTKQDQECAKSQIEFILSEYSDPAEQLYQLAEYVRTDFVEAYTPELKNLSTAYREILMSEIYSCDNFAIAKELMKQYKEKQLQHC